MKNLIFIIFIFPILVYGQEGDSKQRVNEIYTLVKLTDSLAKGKKEGIIEGVITFSHGRKKNFGWEAYFLNENNNSNLPLRIRYSETNQKGLEDLNLYYHYGKLIYAELITTHLNRKSKPVKITTKKFNFENGDVLHAEDPTDSEIDYILQKEKILIKSIYK